MLFHVDEFALKGQYHSHNNKMGITLYHYPRSGPSRFALMVARLLNLDVDVQIIDLSKKEQLNPEFVKVFKFKVNYNVFRSRNGSIPYKTFVFQR